MRRSLFAISIGLLAVAAVGGVVTWVADRDIGAWVAVVALAGGAALAVSLASVLRELLQGIWKVSNAGTRQLSKLRSLETSLRTLNDEEAARSDVLLAEVVKLKNRLRTLERSHSEQLATLNRVDRRQKEDRDRAREVASTVNRVNKRQKTQREESAAAMKRLEQGQSRRIKPILERIEVVQAEKIRPVLRGIEREQALSYRQIEALVSLTSLGLRSPLPHMRNTWAINPDSALFLVKTIFEKTPANTVELGSGISTVLIAKALEVVGSGQFRSLEQDPGFLEQTAQLLRAEGLDQVELVEAGIVDVAIGDADWKWYSPSGLEGLSSVDFVIVDGPPNRTGDQARYPALPMLAPMLTDGALIFLDDANREEERSIVQRWLEEFPVTALDVPKLEKGGALLEWRSQ